MCSDIFFYLITAAQQKTIETETRTTKFHINIVQIAHSSRNKHNYIFISIKPNSYEVRNLKQIFQLKILSDFWKNNHIQSTLCLPVSYFSCSHSSKINTSSYFSESYPLPSVFYAYVYWNEYAPWHYKTERSANDETQFEVMN